MQVKIPGSESFATLPVKNSELYNMILSCEAGRWQKNKVLDLLVHGYTSMERGEKSKATEKSYDYSTSLKNLISRINDALAPTELYSIKAVNSYYAIIKEE